MLAALASPECATASRLRAEIAERLDPVRLLKAGFDSVTRQHIIGSTTACIVSCVPWGRPAEHGGGGQDTAGRSGDTPQCLVQVANLGDSGMMLLRGGSVVVRTTEQTHAFNFPRQLGTGSQDTPSDADSTSFVAQSGDLLILGTDGLFDNMYDEEITSLVLGRLRESPGSCFPPVSAEQKEIPGFAGLARELAIAAYSRARDRTRISPFVRRAVEAGCVDASKVAAGVHSGGKLDDISTIICRIEDSK